MKIQMEQTPRASRREKDTPKEKEPKRDGIVLPPSVKPNISEDSREGSKTIPKSILYHWSDISS